MRTPCRNCLEQTFDGMERQNCMGKCQPMREYRVWLDCQETFYQATDTSDEYFLIDNAEDDC